MKSDVTILKKYKRASRSPFTGDDSTILMLASYEEDNDRIIISYHKYIYLHRDNLGRWLGVSVSKSIMDEQTKLKAKKYYEGKDMLHLLLSYFDEIRIFLRYFSDEIEAIFGLDSETFLYACKARWRKKVKH